MVTDATLREAIGRAWCHEENVAKEMDVDLAEAVLWEIRAIIGNATPAPSDKIAEAARDVQTHRMNWKHAMELVRDNCPLPNEDQDDRSYWDHQIRSLDVAADALRALAGQGETP